MDGKILQSEGKRVIYFERNLNHPVEKVWRTITSPDRIAHWLNAQAQFDLIDDGQITFRWDNGDLVDGKFTKISPPNELEYTWVEKDSGNSLVRWELQVKDEGCLLKLTHTFFESAVVINFLSGWHVHLDVLDLILQEKSADFPWEQFKEMRNKYASIID
ncbi:SRPBCC family protein [Paenibacillus sp. L3-i20]|uniref:SRPBCC family protein n=1 Tax=Paenibacillus sp. L3-i20 TaxID=2905833 RepID=UPI001EDFD139|nr:SRPBCC family protein [Paenibacillus sp. L3-i20]GKU78941.1 ATPase [Paenibacillus sp. L3-i20]